MSGLSYFFKEKQKTHPDEKLRVREHEAIVPLFSLLKKTASRLLEIPAIDGMVDHLVELNDGNPINLQMISKFGLDGSSVIIFFFTFFFHFLAIWALTGFHW